jgi:hypothetical protein
MSYIPNQTREIYKLHDTGGALGVRGEHATERSAINLVGLQETGVEYV